MDDKRFYPIPAGCATPGEGEQKGALLFLKYGDDGFVTIVDHVAEVWELLRLSTGYVSIETICKKVSFDAGLARVIIGDLCEMGVLVQASQLMATLFALTENPPSYPSQATEAEVVALTTTPDLGLQDGNVVVRFGNKLPDSAFAKLLGGRRSIRNFRSSALDSTLLGLLLVQAYSLKHRTVASAGGLNVLRVFFVLCVDHKELPAGLYQFDPLTHEVRRVGDLPHEHELMFAFNSDHVVYGAPCIVIIAASPDRHAKKYGNRGVAFTVFEVGEVASTLMLGATEQGVGSLAYGGLNALAVAQMFGMDLAVSRPQLAVALGYESDQPVVGDTAAAVAQLETAMQRIAPVTDQRVVTEPIGGFQARACFAQNERFVGTGAAASSDQARLAALAESFERYATEVFNRVDLVAPARNLGEWLNPEAVMPLSPQQFAATPWLAPFSADKPWQWVRGVGLHDESEVWVPFDLVGYSVKQFQRKPCVSNSSSGVAAHTTKEEAARRGLLELIERDAFMRHWLAGQAPPRIHTDYLPSFLQRRVERIRSEGRDVVVLNLSQGAHGAVVIGVAICGPVHPAFTLGMAASDQDWQSAAIKAFREADLVNGAQEPSSRLITPQEVRTPLEHGRLYHQPEFGRKVSWLCLGDYAEPPTPQPLQQAMATLLPVVVELSKEDDPLFVVRVLCNRLVPIGFGYRMDHHMHPELRGKVEDRPYLPIPFA